MGRTYIRKDQFLVVLLSVGMVYISGHHRNDKEIRKTRCSFWQYCRTKLNQPGEMICRIVV